IRKSVFLKGCPMRCVWCHNPEGQYFEPQLMVRTASCINCGSCKKVCEHDACIVCGRCTTVCPLGLRAISGKVYRADKLAEKILQGGEILKASGGGVTFTGGEPLAQPAFLLGTIRELQSKLHIAIETSGCAASETFKAVVEKTDLVIMDVKHTDTEIHKRYTGIDNVQILKNLSWLCKSDREFIIRVPLIPGVNDTEENMNNLAELLKGSRHLQKVELLPYNKAAGAKYPMIGKNYNVPFSENTAPNIHTKAFSKYGIRSVVL
ncbi:MAG: glycyl-radical enzyme activating protein, partial [Peptococcales bacterium]